MFRRNSIKLLFTVFVAGLMTPALAQDGGYGLIYVQSARVLPKGHLEMYSGTRFFGKIAQFGSAGNAYTLWNVQERTSFTLGINPNLEIYLSPILYQDTNNESGNVLDGQGNSPDDIFLGFKVGSFGALESPYLFGGRVYARIPTASVHNIIYEPYSAGTLEVGVTLLASYYSNVRFPDAGWSLHANLGYLNHNDVGAELTDNPNDPKPITMSSEILFGAGLLYPAGTFDFSAELNARSFLARPPETAYSREFVSYLTAGVYYKPYRWLTFKMGIDLRILSGEDISNYQNTSLDPPPAADFPNYPAWRGILGVRLGILPFSQYSATEKSALERRADEQQRTLDKILSGEQDEKKADSELSRLRSERVKIEDELKRLRQLLEAEKKKKKKDE